MKLRTLGLIAAVAGTAGAVVWWRRRGAAALPSAQLGLSDGTVRPLDPADPVTIELVAMAADLRRAFETSD